MTSALDKKGNRILGSEAGERVVNQVIKGKSRFQYKCFTGWDEKLWIFYSSVSEWNDRSGYRYGVCRNQ